MFELDLLSLRAEGYHGHSGVVHVPFLVESGGGRKRQSSELHPAGLGKQEHLTGVCQGCSSCAQHKVGHRSGKGRGKKEATCAGFI